MAGKLNAKLAARPINSWHARSVSAGYRASSGDGAPV